MRITILQRGAIKDKQIESLTAIYAKRFQRYGKLTIKEQKNPQWPSSHFRVICDERGEQPSSELFAKTSKNGRCNMGPFVLRWRRRWTRRRFFGPSAV